MRLAAAVCLGALLATAAEGQQPEVRRTFATAGTFEIGGSAGFSRNALVSKGVTGDAFYVVSLSPTGGYFVADELEILIDPLTVDYRWAGSVKSLGLTPMAGVAYNFRANPRVFPYLEGLAGFAYSWFDNGVEPTETRSGFAWAGRGGIKTLLTGTAILNVGLQYQQITLNRSGETERNGSNQIALTVGLSVWL